MIYFDHNASSPMLPQAREAWLDAARSCVGNPSSPHRLGGRADVALNQARESLARLLGCAADEIIFTSGASEANNAIFNHLAQTARFGDVIWISAIEHPSVLAPANFFFRSKLEFIPVSRSGIIDFDWIAICLKNVRPHAIVVLAANNETGVLQPWREASKLARDAGVPLVCDATQWLGKLPANGLGECDFLSGSAHKFGGPRGVGFIKCPPSTRFRPLVHGGPQEEGRRAGTENVPGVLSMLAALEAREEALKRGEQIQLENSKARFEQSLLKALPGSEIIGSDLPRLWNTTSALMPEADCQQRWVVKLDKLGFAVSTGSACSSGNEEPSHVLRAMGYSDAEAGRVLRFSAGWETRDEDWLALSEALQKVYHRMQRLEH